MIYLHSYLYPRTYRLQSQCFNNGTLKFTRTRIRIFRPGSLIFRPPNLKSKQTFSIDIIKKKSLCNPPKCSFVGASQGRLGLLASGL